LTSKEEAERSAFSGAPPALPHFSTPKVTDMRPYLISLAIGLLVGAIYGLLNHRSPAPPVIALVGLFGMLLGEQLVPIAKRLVVGERVAELVKTKCAPEVLGPHAASCRRGEEG
jgi:XapX domain-containing protein